MRIDSGLYHRDNIGRSLEARMSSKESAIFADTGIGHVYFAKYTPPKALSGHASQVGL